MAFRVVFGRLSFGLALLVLVAFFIAPSPATARLNAAPDDEAWVTQARSRADYLIALDRRPAARKLETLLPDAEAKPWDERVPRLALIAVDSTLNTRYDKFDGAIKALRGAGLEPGPTGEQLVELLILINDAQRNGDYDLGQARLQVWLDRPDLDPDLASLAYSARVYFYQLSGQPHKARYAYHLLRRDHAGRARSAAAKYALASTTAMADLVWGDPRVALDEQRGLEALARKYDLPFTGVDELHNIIWLLQRFKKFDAAYDIAVEMERELTPKEADLDVTKLSMLCGRANLLKGRGAEALACFRRGEATLDVGSQYEFRWLGFSVEAALRAGDLAAARAYLARLRRHPRRDGSDLNKLEILKLDAELKRAERDYPAAFAALEAYSDAAMARKDRELQATRDDLLGLLGGETDELAARVRQLEKRQAAQAMAARLAYLVAVLMGLVAAGAVGTVFYRARQKKRADLAV